MKVLPIQVLQLNFSRSSLKNDEIINIKKLSRV